MFGVHLLRSLWRILSNRDNTGVQTRTELSFVTSDWARTHPRGRAGGGRVAPRNWWQILLQLFLPLHLAENPAKIVKLGQTTKTSPRELLLRLLTASFYPPCTAAAVAPFPTSLCVSLAISESAAATTTPLRRNWQASRRSMPVPERTSNFNLARPVPGA